MTTTDIPAHTQDMNQHPLAAMVKADVELWLASEAGVLAEYEAEFSEQLAS